jgi:hypothetical protein
VPAQSRRDVLQDRFDEVSIVVDAQLVRDGQQQRIRLGDCLVLPELLDEKPI